jgi:hypothetical protein
MGNKTYKISTPIRISIAFPFTVPTYQPGYPKIQQKYVIQNAIMSSNHRSCGKKSDVTFQKNDDIKYTVAEA